MGAEKVEITSQTPWELIKMLAEAQSQNPLVAIEQLVDNALTSGAKNVVVELRKKGAHKSSPRVVVRDDGDGWHWVKDEKDPHYGLPDLWYTVSHIGDSIKSKYDEYKRKREAGLEVGHFGIGLLSFWGLGERMTVTTRSKLSADRLSESARMTWIRQCQDAEIDAPFKPGLEGSGTEIIVDRLIESQMALVTGRNVADFLKKACRPLLTRTGVRLIVDDHGKKIEVRPSRFVGTPFPVRRVSELELELYIPTSEVDPTMRHVSLFKVAEKVMDDVSHIPELNKSPWNDGRVYGVVSYPRGALTPDRTGLVNDEHKAEFISLMLKATPQVVDFVDSEEKKLRELKSRETSKIFREKWQTIFRELPESWRRPGSEDVVIPPETPQDTPEKPVLGPLDHVDIVPADGSVLVNGIIGLKAMPRDSRSNLITRDVLYGWQVIQGGTRARLDSTFGREATLVAGPKRGIVTVHVSAIEDGGLRKSSTNVHIVDFLPVPSVSHPKGENPPNQGWFSDPTGARSRYLKNFNVIEINAKHPDYKSAESSGQSAELHYMLACYSRELALDRWMPLVRDPHELSEKVLELTILAERVFGFESPQVPKKKGRPPKWKTAKG